MTSSIVGTYPDAAPLEDARPRRPVLRPLTEVLPGLVAPAPPDPQAPAPAPPAPPPDPHAHAMAERVLRCAVEIVGGRRPAHQLTAVLHPVLLDYLTGLHGAAGHLRPRVHTVHSQQPAPGCSRPLPCWCYGPGCARCTPASSGLPAPRTRWRCTVLHVALTRGDVGSRR